MIRNESNSYLLTWLLYVCIYYQIPDERQYPDGRYVRGSVMACGALSVVQHTRVGVGGTATH